MIYLKKMYFPIKLKGFEKKIQVYLGSGPKSYNHKYYRANYLNSLLFTLQYLQKVSGLLVF